MRRIAQHGTNSMYCGRACRCEPCVEAHRVYMKGYKALYKVPVVAELLPDLDEVFADQVHRVKTTLAAVSRKQRYERLSDVSDDLNDLEFEVKR